MKVLNWNVKGGLHGDHDRVRQQLRLVLERDPDVIALREITEANYVAREEGLRAAGYDLVSGRELAQVPYPPPPYHPDARTTTQISRLYFNLVASRIGCEELPGLSWADPSEAATAFPEKYVAARVDVDGHPVSIHNTHPPPGVSRGILKVRHFEAVARRIDEEGDKPTILCGDFNAPLLEDEEGPNETGRPKRDAPRGGWGELGERWNAAEISVLAHRRLRDVYRDVRSPGDPFPASHYTVSVAQKKGAKRYDYVFASAHFETASCRYLTDWLEDGYSDHAAVAAELRLR